MNKKLFLGMFAAATMLLATSCQNDELDAVQSGNEATVSFSLGVEGGVQTRAISDGTGAKQLTYRVFDKDGKPISETLGKVTETVESYPHTVTLTLAKGQTYKIAFWAQNSECDAYNTDEFPEVKVAYKDSEGNTYANNDETRDAFFKTIEYTVGINSKQSESVVLKRPFAQLNVGVYASDWEAAKASGIEIQKSDVTISNVATSMNLITGNVEGSEQITYSLAAIPGQKLKNVDLEGYEEQEDDFHYLSMCYLLVDDGTEGGANRAIISNVEFNFYPSTGNVINFAQGLDNIPVQRNYRTNIIGKILTGDIDFNITIDAEYDDDINLEKTITAGATQDDLNTILSKGGVVTVSGAPDATNGQISLDGLTLADDLYLVVENDVEVTSLVLGGNNANDTDKPTVTVEFKGKYPNAITFMEGTENVILKGNSGSDNYGSQIALNNAKNVTISGFKSNYNTTALNKYTFDISGNNSENIIIENCVTTESIGQRFVNVNQAKSVIIRNNTIIGRDGERNEGTHAAQRPIEVTNTNDVLIQGNNITNTMNKNGMWVNKCDKVVITGNTIKNAYTDGIKVDRSYNVTITDNEVEANENGIRLNELEEAEATFVITGNKVTTKNSQNADGTESFYGINIGQTAVDVNAKLDIKNNVAESVAGNNFFYLGSRIKPVTGSDYETPYTLADGTVIFADGSFGVESIAQLSAVVNEIESPEISVKLMNDITGEATLEQRENVKVTVNGNQKTWNGVIIVDGKSKAYATAGLTIQYINFEAQTLTNKNYINLGIDNNTRYTNNVTIENCTFTYSGSEEVVAVRQKTAGCKNLKIIGCTVNSGMHSMLQAANVGESLNFTDCKVYSKNGVNLNNTDAFTMNGCIFDTKGHAIRVGVNGTVNSTQKIFEVSNSSLKSAGDGGDAVIIFRDSATNAKLTLTDTTLEGTTKISGNTESTIINGTY